MADSHLQFASIYSRDQGDSRIRLVDGPFELEAALAVFHELIDDEITDPLGDVLYYEIRGVGRCAVRSRAWISSWARSVRYEILPPRFPGRRVVGG